MPDTLPDQQVLETWVHDKPRDLIRTLPDNVKRRRAEEHLEIMYGYVKQAREKKADR